jgi:hypothetical protein
LPIASGLLPIGSTRKHEDDVMAEVKPLVVCIPPDLRRELEPIAAAQRRSLRNAICAALAEWLEDRNAAIARAGRFASRRSKERVA